MKYYVLCKEPLPMDVDFMLSDSLEVSLVASAAVQTLFHFTMAGGATQAPNGQES